MWSRRKDLTLERIADDTEAQVIIPKGRGILGSLFVAKHGLLVLCLPQMEVAENSVFLSRIGILGAFFLTSLM